MSASAAIAAQSLSRSPTVKLQAASPGHILTEFDCSIRGAGLSTRSTDFAMRCNYIRSGWRYARPECRGTTRMGGERRRRRLPLFELLLRACLRLGNTRDTCARCARNTCDLLPTVYLLAPTDYGEYTCISYRRSAVSLETNKISACYSRYKYRLG